MVISFRFEMGGPVRLHRGDSMPRGPCGGCRSRACRRVRLAREAVSAFAYAVDAAVVVSPALAPPPVFAHALEWPL
ncbi:MAG TPA: hypothetical protein VFG73_00545 [Rhodanobacteraceae bacterium]|nr:hypothetical protein [Rhodanobacteraceae bacterium]